MFSFIRPQLAAKRPHRESASELDLAPPEPSTGDAKDAGGWHLSSLELAEGLDVTEVTADDEELARAYFTRATR